MEGTIRERCEHVESNTRLTRRNRNTTSCVKIIRAAGLGGLIPNGQARDTVCLCDRHYKLACKSVEADAAAVAVPLEADAPNQQPQPSPHPQQPLPPPQPQPQPQPQQQQQQQLPTIGGSSGGGGADALPPSRPATRPRPAPNLPAKPQSVPRAASATSGKRYDRMVRHMRAPELVRMLQEKAAELKALQRSNQDLHAAMVRRRTKQRIQQRAQRGLILRLGKKLRSSEAALERMKQVKLSRGMASNVSDSVHTIPNTSHNFQNFKLANCSSPTCSLFPGNAGDVSHHPG